MHRRFITMSLFLSLATMLALVLANGCRDSGITDPATSDNPTNSISLYAAKGGTPTNTKGGGGGKINCKRDKAIDQPIELQSVTIESAMRLHIQAGGGQDASNVVKPNWYEIEDESGKITYVPSGIYVGDSNDLLNIYVQGFRPGGRYLLRLLSQDACANTAYSATQTITMPPLGPDSSAPVIMSLVVKNKAALIAVFRVIEVQTADNTGLSKIEFMFNGQLLYTMDLQNSFRYWLEGQTPTYDWVVPSEMKGQSGTVTVRVYDASNNVTEQSTQATL